LIEQLLSRGAALVRLDFPLGSSWTKIPTTARISPAGREEKFLAASSVALAAAISPNMQGESLCLRIDGAEALILRPGAAVTGFVPVEGPEESGVIVPHGSIVRHSGRAWTYVQINETDFTRREVPMTHASESGWFVTVGFRAGDKLVVSGAQTVLSEELKSQFSESE
jgi:hypothetical protein